MKYSKGKVSDIQIAKRTSKKHKVKVLHFPEQKEIKS